MEHLAISYNIYIYIYFYHEWSNHLKYNKHLYSEFNHRRKGCREITFENQTWFYLSWCLPAEKTAYSHFHVLPGLSSVTLHIHATVKYKGQHREQVESGR